MHHWKAILNCILRMLPKESPFTDFTHILISTGQMIGIHSMAYCKIAAFPVVMHWRYCSLALHEPVISLIIWSSIFNQTMFYTNILLSGTYLHTGHRQLPRSQFNCRYDSRSKHWMCLQSCPLAGSPIRRKVMGHLSDTLIAVCSTPSSPLLFMGLLLVTPVKFLLTEIMTVNTYIYIIWVIYVLNFIQDRADWHSLTRWQRLTNWYSLVISVCTYL